MSNTNPEELGYEDYPSANISRNALTGIDLIYLVETETEHTPEKGCKGYQDIPKNTCIIIKCDYIKDCYGG